MEKRNPEQVKDFMEIVGKIVFALLAASYALGLIVIEIFYNRYGVYSLNLLQLNYIVAGVLVLGPPIVLFSWIMIAFHWVTLSWRPWKQLKRWLLFLAGIGVVFAGFTYFRPIRWTEFVEILGCSLVICFFAGLTYRSFSKCPRFHSNVYASSILLSTAVVIYSSFFGRNIYGHIPRYLGGGEPPYVQLFLNAESVDAEYFNRVGLRYCKGSHQFETQVVKFLFTTDDEYVLRTCDDQHTISIKRDLIHSVLYLQKPSQPCDDKPCISLAPKATSYNPTSL